VWADPVRLRQVLRNLIKNAFRHGAAPVTIRAVATPDGAEVQVTDHGPGVPVESRDELFRPFHPLASSDTQPGSLGLGLWISHRLMRLMGGDLTYRDDPQPTFVVSLRGVEVTDHALIGSGV
jgi:two-component system sensor histidine kinase MtrB